MSFEIKALPDLTLLGSQKGKVAYFAALSLNPSCLGQAWWVEAGGSRSSFLPSTALSQLPRLIPPFLSSLLPSRPCSFWVGGGRLKIRAEFKLNLSQTPAQRVPRCLPGVLNVRS